MIRPTAFPLPGRSRRALACAIVGTSVFAGALLVGSVLGPLLRPPTPPAGLPAADLAPGAVSQTDRAIGSLQERLQAQPDDQRALTALGLAYLVKVRESNDPAYYPRAEGVLARAHALAPNDADTLVGLGTLALARHRFADGLAWGRQAVAADPYKAAAFGVVADAQTELGQYDAAVDTIQQMVNLRPDQSSYARVSYARELHGDLDGAAEMMDQAVRAGVPGSEATEWTRVQLANLELSRGRLDQAEALARQALARLPGYPPALGGLARVMAARGESATAIQLFQQAAAISPQPELLIRQAEVERASGRGADAARTEALVRVEERLFADSGVDTDLELALFDLDHDANVPGAVASLRALWARRPSIQVADALAWGLYKAGRCDEAQGFVERALRLGSRDALMHYHAARVAECRGDLARAQALTREALALNPYFSVPYAPQARLLLQALAATRHPGGAGGQALR